MTGTTTPPISWIQWRAGVMGALNVLLVILSVRLTLLASVVGAFWLAYLAVLTADPYKLGVLGLYGALIVGPLVWLASRR